MSRSQRVVGHLQDLLVVDRSSEVPRKVTVPHRASTYHIALQPRTCFPRKLEQAAEAYSAAYYTCSDVGEPRGLSQKHCKP